MSLSKQVLLRIRAINEIAERRQREITFTEPLQLTSDMKDFLMGFYMSVYTPEKQEFFEKERQNFSSVEIFFQKLCVASDSVSFEDFWQRYEYRCADLERVIQELTEREATESNIDEFDGGSLPEKESASKVTLLEEQDSCTISLPELSTLLNVGEKKNASAQRRRKAEIWRERIAIKRILRRERLEAALAVGGDKTWAENQSFDVRREKSSFTKHKALGPKGIQKVRFASTDGSRPGSNQHLTQVQKKKSVLYDRSNYLLTTQGKVSVHDGPDEKKSEEKPVTRTKNDVVPVADSALGHHLQRTAVFAPTNGDASTSISSEANSSFNHQLLAASRQNESRPSCFSRAIDENGEDSDYGSLTGRDIVIDLSKASSEAKQFGCRAMTPVKTPHSYEPGEISEKNSCSDTEATARSIASSHEGCGTNDITVSVVSTAYLTDDNERQSRENCDCQPCAIM